MFLDELLSQDQFGDLFVSDAFADVQVVHQRSVAVQVVLTALYFQNEFIHWIDRGELNLAFLEG